MSDELVALLDVYEVGSIASRQRRKDVIRLQRRLAQGFQCLPHFSVHAPRAKRTRP
jgi:hypothetical protein